MNSAAVQGESWFLVRRRRKIKTSLAAQGLSSISLKKISRIDLRHAAAKNKI
jgi:hypothetical protein